MEVAGERGRLSYVPDYPSRQPPTFTAEFPISSAQRDSLYRRLGEERLLRDIKVSEQPPGSSILEATITDEGSSYKLGPQPGEDDASLAAVRPDVLAPLPDAVWSDARRQRTAYASVRYPGQSV